MPKVSIIVPVYNVERYIEQCMESLVNQTLQDIEIICIDDCGHDKSIEIVEKFAATDKRITVLHNERNSGISVSRNNAIEISTAPYIMFCDSDDFYAPDMCKKMYNAITESGADIAMCDIKVIYEADHKQKSADDAYFKLPAIGTVEMSEHIRNHTAVTVWNKIYRREILDKYDVRFPIGLRYEDEYFWRVYTLWCKNIFFIPDELYCYRRRTGSIMNTTFNSKDAKSLDRIKIALEYYDYLTKWDLLDSDFGYTFWDNEFMTYVESGLQWCQDMRANKRARAELSEFIDKNYQKGKHPFTTCQTLEKIKQGTFRTDNRYCFGMFRMRIFKHKREFRVLGIPVWIVRTTDVKTRYFLFGIHVATKYAQFDISHFREQHFSPDQLLTELRSLGEFSYVLNPGNMGDMLIAAATFGFFEKHGIKYRIFDGTPADNVVYSGGGVWVNEYKHDWINRLDIFRNAKRVIILPHTFDNCPELIDVMDERFVVFCRERKSYDYIKSQNTGATVLLEHDMAFFMPREILAKKFRRDEFRNKLYKQLRELKFGPIAKFMRRDVESVQNVDTDVDLSGVLPGCDAAIIQKHAVFIAQQMLATVDRADAVITDRLHVSIAAMLMGKPVYMLDNINKKLSGVYKQSMSACRYVHFCKTMPDIGGQL